MSVRTETQVPPTEENGMIGSNNLDDEAPPPLIVEGEIDTNKTQEILESEQINEEEEG